MRRILLSLAAGLAGLALTAPAYADDKDGYKKYLKRLPEQQERQDEFFREQQKRYAEQVREQQKREVEFFREQVKREAEFQREQQKRYAEQWREQHQHGREYFNGKGKYRRSHGRYDLGSSYHSIYSYPDFLGSKGNVYSRFGPQPYHSGYGSPRPEHGYRRPQWQPHYPQRPSLPFRPSSSAPGYPYARPDCEDD